MLVTHNFQELNALIEDFKKKDSSLGFVPTMGALHAGHLSLVEIAQKHAQICVISIFVNPTQFAPNEDFDSYPRDVQGDLKLCEAKNVDVVYLPRVEDIYPDGEDSAVKAGAAAEGLESDFRPTFFDGVVNVVHRLFSQVQPDVAIFGEKDFQQLMVIKEMVANLGLPIEIIGAPIKRDSYGLALSSRNAYLSEDEITIARQLNKILRVADNEEEAKAQILAAGFDKVDYVSERWGRLLAAAWLGTTRLIDNLG